MIGSIHRPTSSMIWALINGHELLHHAQHRHSRPHADGPDRVLCFGGRGHDEVEIDVSGFRTIGLALPDGLRLAGFVIAGGMGRRDALSPQKPVESSARQSW